MRLLSLFIAALFFTATLSAQTIYKYTDEEGRTHYSTEPQDLSAKPAELPEITKAEFETHKNLPETCSKHGGINCQLGADEDGSVICYDGFRGSVARFKFHCMSPKVQFVTAEQSTDGFKVIFRNANSVQAEGMKIVYQPSGVGYPLEGPIAIAGFAMEEYSLKLPEELLRQELEAEKLFVQCLNCP